MASTPVLGLSEALFPEINSRGVKLTTLKVKNAWCSTSARKDAFMP